jgi:hypothetical protein
MITKLVCWVKGHELTSESSCPFTGYTYILCDKCGSTLHAYVKESS